VAFEAVFVPALLFADLTIPSEPLKSFAAHLIRDIFARSDLRSWHVVNRWRFVFRRSLKASCARSMKTVSPSVEGRMVMVKAQELGGARVEAYFGIWFRFDDLAEPCT
jgi:hypothetical protein